MPPPDLVLANANVLTLHAPRPRAWLVAVRDGRVVALGEREDLTALRGRGTRVVDCGGATLLPGFEDAHMHLLALASRLAAVDCGPEEAPTIEALVERVAAAAARTPQGEWVRAAGYDEVLLAEGRHPTRHDLDRATPHHPVRLDHRTGHACVLNSLALRLLGVTAATPDPAQGVIQRDEAGEPTGVLLELSDWVSGRMAPWRRGGETEARVAAARRLLAQRGVTAIQDATVTNHVTRWRLLRRLRQEGRLRQRVTLMPGAQHLDAFLQEGLAAGGGDEGVRLGPAKVVLTLTTGAPHPPEAELERLVWDAHRSGFQVAVHAVEEEAVALALGVVRRVQRGMPRPDARHRIEHAAECPPRLQQRVRAEGVCVVTQPGFLEVAGERYLVATEPRLQPHLYPVRSLLLEGVAVAAGSDAPAGPPDPLRGVAAAVTRRTRGGRTVAPAEAVPPLTALALHTAWPAYVVRAEGERGTIAPGKAADLALLDTDPLACEPEALAQARVLLTLVGGQAVWEG